MEQSIGGNAMLRDVDFICTQLLFLRHYFYSSKWESKITVDFEEGYSKSVRGRLAGKIEARVLMR